MKVAVLGAGGAGLAAARKLREVGAEVLVFEAEARAGGKIHSHAEGGFLCEEGPNAITAASPTALRLARELALPIVEAQPPHTRFVIRGGRMRKAPSPGLLSAAGWARAALEPVLWKRPENGQAGAEETLRAFLVRHLGEEAGGLGARLMAAGVYGGDPDRLSARQAFGRFTALEEAGGSLVRGGFQAAKRAKAERPVNQPAALWSVSGGLGALTDKLAEGLGDSLKLSTRVEQVTQAGKGLRLRLSGAGAGEAQVEGVVSALPPRPAASLLSNVAPGTAALSEVRSAPMAVVHLGFKRADLAQLPAGFGVLNGDGANEVLGILFPSSLFPGRAPEDGVLFTAILGGMLHPEAVALGDEALIDTCLGALRPFFGPRREPVLRRVLRWAEAVPQPELGHAQRVATAVAGLAKAPPCELAGAAFGGVSVEQVLASGELAAQRLLTRLQSTFGVEA